MTAGKDRVSALRERVGELKQREHALRATITAQKRRLKAKSTDVQIDAQRQIKAAEGDLKQVQPQLARAELALRLEEARLTTEVIFAAMREQDPVLLEVGGAGSPESDRAVAARLRELTDVRSMQNFLKGRADEIVEGIRPFVIAHFKGYTRSDDPEKRYPAWFADASLHVAVLQDNPLYALSVEQLIALVGLVQAMALLKVDYPAVAAMAKQETLKDLSGQPVTFEALAELRTRSERTPLLQIKARGEEPIENLLDLIDPKYATRGLGIESLNLDAQTEHALRTAGYTLVEQVRASFDALQSIKGIGPKRAERIIDALVARAREAA